MRHVLFRLFVAFLPMALTPLWAYLISEGHIGFGGGEKDLLLLIPWFLWSLLYLIGFLSFRLKRWTLKRTVLHAAGGAIVMLVLVWIVMFIWSSGGLGVS